MSKQKELAYRYDLLITPNWRDRFDTIVNEKVKIPKEGRVLDVNSGTGAHAIEFAERLGNKGEVIGTDSDLERVEIARAKAQVKKLGNVRFEHLNGTDLPFADDEFDLVIGDASMTPPYEIEDLLTEMARVALPDAPVALKLTTHGSFDEFFSIYWEALLDIGLNEEVWGELEALIQERKTVSDIENMAREIGLRDVDSVTGKEDFEFSSAEEFLESPLIKDTFLEEWLTIVPADRQQQVYDEIAAIIERERNEGVFEVSIKATVVTGIK